MSDPHRRVCLAGGRPVAAQCADRRGCHGLCRRAVQSRGARLSRGRSRGTQDRSVRDVQRLLPVGDPARPAGWISIAGAGFPDHGAGRRRCVRPTHRRAAGRTAPTPGRLGARKNIDPAGLAGRRSQPSVSDVSRRHDRMLCAVVPDLSGSAHAGVDPHATQPISLDCGDVRGIGSGRRRRAAAHHPLVRRQMGGRAQPGSRRDDFGGLVHPGCSHPKRPAVRRRRCGHGIGAVGESAGGCLGSVVSFRNACRGRTVGRPAGGDPLRVLQHHRGRRSPRRKSGDRIAHERRAPLKYR
ncbi:Uncharacterised protein [Mycobacterium tuberculosis]|uniref:Uncharacterized protein n=1 Tax=Mycobacterium tuberculosis TaxID=1773 RepID=A0A655DQ14_MYCTX|nr:Uncharacterised protein [Mycobacterium tuberculosis]